MRDGSDGTDVDAFMKKLDHPLKPAIEELRSVVKGARDGITEHIKWNAPSFCYRGDDRVTLRLHPSTRLQIIFHRGAKMRSGEDSGFEFRDESGLIRWLANDRGVVTFGGLEEVKAATPALRDLVRRWMEATS
jgi:hypothetical protein